MGIKVSLPTELPKTLKIANYLNSFAFEEEYGEMNKWGESDKKALTNLTKKLFKLVSKYKKK